MDTLQHIKINELRKLKEMFEQCEQSGRDMDTAGSFGVFSTFFGNMIEWNHFDIPYSAMRLIYRANKEKIDHILSLHDK